MLREGVVFKKEIVLSAFLSKPQEVYQWIQAQMPNDNLSIENTVIINSFNRYPLIIDPSEKALNFLMNFYRNDKIIKSSFSDEGFLKTLENALRFGLPIIITNVERINPILNSVLNKETSKQQGRVLIRVGDQEIDFNANFKLFLVTKNSGFQFTPDLCSRVSFVNFTVTQRSLETQLLSKFLMNEQPEVEKRKINQIKIQGEFLNKLRQLEEDLLMQISSSKGGNILENEELLNQLTKIKKESQEIQQEIEKSDLIMEEINQAVKLYEGISCAGSRLFFILKDLPRINSVYQFSLEFYLKIID